MKDDHPEQPRMGDSIPDTEEEAKAAEEEEKKSDGGNSDDELIDNAN